MSQLSILREQLASLRRRRRAFRVCAALAAMVAALVGTLAAIFVLDWELSMSRPQRLLAMAIGAGALVWLYRTYARPLLDLYETELDVALLIERQQQIDSDLVAALQFESPAAPQWGSRQLEAAVISYVGEFSRDCNLLEGFSTGQSIRRGSMLIAAVLAVVGAALWQPRYAATFLNRLAMGSQHYPTRTSIDELRVNGIEVRHDGQIIRVGYGQPVEFAVRLSGETATELHKIELTNISTGATRPADLLAVKVKISRADAQHADVSSAGSSFASMATAGPGAALFRAELTELVDSLQFQVFAGDAWSDPARLEVIPLPIIQSKLTVTPPAYARQSTPNDEPAGSRQISVLEGSQVDLQLECLNKRLTAASLMIDGKSYPLEPSNAAGRRWNLPVKGSPLARVDRPMRYRIQVTDEDGLHLTGPIDGFVRVKEDRAPTITAAVDVQFFLPAGQPKIRYTANDDYGISAIRALVEIQHEGGAAADPVRQAFEVLPISPDKPLTRPRLPCSSVYALPLSTFSLVKGDRVKVTLEATGFRGDQAGKTSRSDSFLFHITDESGIMAALGKSDLRAAQQMDALIQQQTQTGVMNSP